MRVLAPALVICLFTFGPDRVAHTAAADVVAGIVVDSLGGVIPGASVELRQGPRVERTAVTNEKGEFRFEKVPPGRYEIRATLPGFLDATTAVAVGEKAVPQLRLTMQIGALQETVMVSSAAPTVNTMSARVASGRQGAGGAGYMRDALGASRYDPNFNTEAYDHIQENRFHRVADDPRSTFSIDVDTASYANVRRFLNDGTLPPRGCGQDRRADQLLPVPVRRIRRTPRRSR